MGGEEIQKIDKIAVNGPARTLQQKPNLPLLGLPPSDGQTNKSRWRLDRFTWRALACTRVSSDEGKMGRRFYPRNVGGRARVLQKRSAVQFCSAAPSPSRADPS